VSINHYRIDTFDTNTEPNHINSTNEGKEFSRSIIVPHTIFMFIPGNPGCVGWYIDMLCTIVKQLGAGYAARAVSYAGHGVGENIVSSNAHCNDNIPGDDNCNSNRNSNRNVNRRQRKSRIAHTVDGQVEHKIEWTDCIVSEMISITNKRSTSDKMNTGTHGFPFKFVFLTHSIGSHLVQRMMLLRKDFLLQTKLIIHLTPFIRFDPTSSWTKNTLSTIANSPQISISVLKAMAAFVSCLPPKLVDLYLEKVANIPHEKDRKLARELYSQTKYAQNFLELGTEEIREIPEIYDYAALRLIGESCPINILYCRQDHWAPLSHMNDIKESQKSNLIPKSISVEYNDQLLHGFVVYPEMITPVVDFVLKSVKNIITTSPDQMQMIRSNL